MVDLAAGGRARYSGERQQLEGVRGTVVTVEVLSAGGAEFDLRTNAITAQRAFGRHTAGTLTRHRNSVSSRSTFTSGREVVELAGF